MENSNMIDVTLGDAECEIKAFNCLEYFEIKEENGAFTSTCQIMNCNRKLAGKLKANLARHLKTVHGIGNASVNPNQKTASVHTLTPLQITILKNSIKDKSCIWKKGEDNDSMAMDQAWESIAENVGANVQICQKKWDSIRKRFIYLKKLNIDLKTESTPDARTRLKYIDPELDFLSADYKSEGLDFAGDFVSKSNSSDDGTDDDYFGDKTGTSAPPVHTISSSRNSLHYSPSMSRRNFSASSRYMKKRKMNDSTGTSETIGTSKTSVRLNGYSPDKKEECNCAAGKKVKKRIDAEEKWWIAQYALYSKLNRAQKFEMRKTISELQFKFEYENLANAEPEILLKTDQNSENELTSDDDPLQW